MVFEEEVRNREPGAFPGSDQLMRPPRAPSGDGGVHMQTESPAAWLQPHLQDLYRADTGLQDARVAAERTNEQSIHHLFRTVSG